MRNLEDIKKVVIKIGSSSLVNEDYSLNYNLLNDIFRSIKDLKNSNISICIVTSGAVVTGMHTLGISKKPKDMALKQACAAVGQAKLMEAYNKVASNYNLVTGQILLNHDDFQKRSRMTHLKDTLDSMLKNNIIPIINENDALAVDEIKVGDNDTLAALVTPMVEADLLILFSDIDGLFDKNPKIYEDAKLIPVVNKIDDRIKKMVSGTTTDVGTGGMETKINAAFISTISGSNMIICNSNELKNLYNIVMGDEIGTLFIKNDNQIKQRESWVIFNCKSSGEIIIDDGLVNRLKDKRVSILPQGIKDVNGDFSKDEVIDVRNLEGKLLFKGITNYSNTEIKMILGHNSKELQKILGYIGKKEVIHANNLVRVEDNLYGYLIK